MAGKVAKYGRLSFGTGNSSSESSEFRENHSSGSGNGKLPNKRRSGNIMEEYLSNFLEEDTVIELLETDKKRGQALQHLDRQFHENNSLLIFQDKLSLFSGFASALADRDKNVRIQCTKLISKIIPQLGNDLDKCLHVVLPKIVANIGDTLSLSLQKESTQMLHVYMKNSSDVYQILRTIAKSGMRHEDIKTRRQIINTFPTLLFPEFKNEDFFDIVFALATYLSENSEKGKVYKTLQMVKKFVGNDVFDNYIEKLPSPLKVIYSEMRSTENRLSSSSSLMSLEPEVLSLNGDFSNIDLRTITLPPAPSLSASKKSLESLDNRRHQNNNNYHEFDKSTYFDSNTVKNSLGGSSYSRLYSTRSNKENYYASSVISDVDQPLSQHYEFGFITKNVIEKFSNSDFKIRLQALEEIKSTIHNLRDISPLMQNFVPLISLLQPLVEDSNSKVSRSALQVFEVIAEKSQKALKPYLRQFILAVSRRFGTSNNIIRSEYTSLLLHLMGVFEPGTVLECLWPKLQDTQWKVREDTVNLITAALLRFSLGGMEVAPKVLCRHVAKMLIDSESAVRLATLECVAVIGHYMGKNMSVLTAAVDNVEVNNDDATGIMAAVQARLVKRQLPRLQESMLVEYAVTSTSSISASNSADQRWVNAVAQPSSTSLSNSMKVRSSSTDPDQPKVGATTRHYPRSAGKHRNNFPWTRQEQASEDHPSSAPVSKTQRSNANDFNPPLRPRNTWGPETELPQRRVQRANDVTYISGPAQSGSSSSGTSYAELYQRQKEANAGKTTVTSGGRLKHLSEDQNAFERTRGVNSGGYQPSFASKESSITSSSLSNSCPSTFFKENGQRRPSPRRNQEQDQEENDSPIHLKPKIVRSAKRRGLNAKNEDMDGTFQSPVKLKNSASPRLDRISNNPTREKVRPLFKAPSSLMPDFFDEPSNELSINNYTPSGLQQHSTNSFSHTMPKAVIRNPQQKLKSPTKHNFQNDRYSNEPVEYSSDKRNFPSPLHKSMSLPFPKEQDVTTDISFGTSPPAQQSSTPRTAPGPGQRTNPDTSEFKALELIRHSAQKKRDRMQRSISSSREASARNSPNELNGSYSSNQIVDGHLSSSSQLTSSLLSESRDSLESFYVNGQSNRQTFDANRSPISNNSTVPDSGYTSYMTESRKSRKSSSSTSKVDSEFSMVMTKASLARPGSGKVDASPKSPTNDPPQVKYNPRSGVSFGNDPQPVSVVGLGYGPKSPGGISENSLISSPSLTPTNSSSNLSVNSSAKQLSSVTARERRKNQRSSALGMASSTQVNHSDQDETFNVTGKAIRDYSSTQFFDNNDSSASHDAILSISPISGNSNDDKSIVAVYGRAVRQRNSSTSEDTIDDQVPLSASLRLRSLKKREDLEIFRKNRKFQESKSESSEPSVLPNKHKPKSNSPPQSDNPRKIPQKTTGDLSKPSSGRLRTTTDILPCDNPDRAVSEALSSLQTTNKEEWEGLCNAMHTIRRVATFHKDNLLPRMHDIFVALCQNVHNLRSQVSRASVACLTDIYTHLKKPALDTDVEIVVKALLIENGKSNAFLREEINKCLQYVVANCTSGKVLNAFVPFGVNHKSKDIRSTSAQFCFLLVDKMGPGKCLSGVKDMTDKLLSAIASFVVDPNPDCRYYARRMVHSLMTHDDFMKCLDTYLTQKQSKEVKECMRMVKERGVGSISSASSRKNDSGLRRNGSTRAPTRNNSSQGSPDTSRLPQISSGSMRKRGTPKIPLLSDADQDDLRTLCKNLSQGDMVERKQAVNALIEKIETNKSLIDDNIVKVMDAYVSLLTTSNSKLNMLGLSNLVMIMEPLKESLRDCVQTLVPPVCKLLGSKAHNSLALQVLDLFIKTIDHVILLPLIANSAMYAPGRTKIVAIEKLAGLISSVGPRKPQAVERHALPVLWSLFSQKQSANMRREVRMLAESLNCVLGDTLLQYAESRNLSSQLSSLLDNA